MKPEFHETNRAVSPVIGVILMVAITVILAAVIGTFVLGLGGSMGQTAPSASINWDWDASSSELTVTHSGGDRIDADQVRLMVNGSVYCDDGTNHWDSETISAGSSCTATEVSASFGDTARLVWDGGDRSSTISTYRIP